MEYSDSYLRENLPPEDPARHLVPGDVLREIALWTEREQFNDSELLARSVQWTYAIFSELGLGNFTWQDEDLPYRFYPWELDLTLFVPKILVGLYDPDRELSGFGLAINLHGQNTPPFFVAGNLYFPRLERTFPIAFRQVSTELHVPHPVDATTTCWARCDTTEQWGVITAGHAVNSNRVGSPVPLNDATTGILQRSFWQPIDAAFVLTPAPIAQIAPLPVLDFPAAGLPVTVECKYGSESRNVVSACNSLGFYQTRQFPILFFLDRPCLPGDSGSLIRAANGDACGIYCGSQPSPSNGGTSGRAQHFAQAMFALGVHPYL